MGEPIETIEGWYALHDFRRIDWDTWQNLGAAQRREAVRELTALATQYHAVAPDVGSFGLYSVIGHKADLLFLHFRAEPQALWQLERRLDQGMLASLLHRPYSYFSVVELSKYLARGLNDEDARASLRKRLQPSIPDVNYVCFYPMNKRRQGNDNWYMTSRDERRDLMKGHGIIGHKYHEQVTQIITGSQGLDDWEWGVSLFADDLLPIKKLIYEMRFDEASARFADFGPFYIGLRVNPPNIAEILGG
ncbi:MAG: heme-dependent peroxidase [Sulfobacillus acidophilus]|uniref:Coproheme decarboxylase n=1 Tax=Sulfobacillus acidophilus TaxID=53633 RepID=A0A2T2WHU0_9FIRM|nr:MAG: heme-dependent peroxidase [Sulfobacillus acidophilus]